MEAFRVGDKVKLNHGVLEISSGTATVTKVVGDLIEFTFNGTHTYTLPANLLIHATYADIKADIRNNHEKLISGEITPDNPVEHPKHYNSHPSGVECITVAQWHSFAVGNVFKYLWRAGLKNEATELEDLRKARQYLEFEIERIENSET